MNLFPGFIRVLKCILFSSPFFLCVLYTMYLACKPIGLHFHGKSLFQEFFAVSTFFAIALISFMLFDRKSTSMNAKSIFKRIIQWIATYWAGLKVVVYVHKKIFCVGFWLILIAYIDESYCLPLYLFIHCFVVGYSMVDRRFSFLYSINKIRIKLH